MDILIKYRYLVIILVVLLLLLGSSEIIGNTSSNYVNVQDYGAVGNGINDDTIAIQSAIDDAYARGISTVVIPAGHYMVSVEPTAVNLRSNITIKMLDGAVVEAIPTSRSSYRIFMVSNCENVIFQGGTIVGERDGHIGTGGEHGMGIYITMSTDVTVKDVTIRDFWGDGIYVGMNAHKPSNRVMIDNVVLDNNRRQGVSITAGDNIVIENSIIRNTNGTLPMFGIDIETNDPSIPVTNIVIRNNIFYDNVRGDVLLGAHCEGIEIYGNTSLPGSIVSSWGMHLAHGHNIKVYDNNISGRNIGVMAKNNVGVDIYSNVIEGRVEGGEYRGTGVILDSFSTDVTVRDNSITNVLRGFYFGDSERAIIANNHIENVQQDGILMWSGATNTTIENNTIRNVIERYGIYARGHNFIIKNNTFENISSDYLRVYSGSNYNISANHFIDIHRTQHSRFIFVDASPSGVEILSNKFESLNENKYAVTISSLSTNIATIKYNIALYSYNPFNVSDIHIVEDNYVKGDIPPPEPDPDPTPDPEPIPVTDVTIPEEDQDLFIDDTFQFTAVVKPDDADDKSVIWSTDNSNAVIINDNGLATAVAEGIANIIVTTNCGGFTDSVTVSVLRKPVPVTGVSIIEGNQELFEGESVQLTAVVEPDDADDKAVVWSSSDTSVATVEDGLVVAMSEGSAEITVVTNDGGFTDSVNVLVKVEYVEPDPDPEPPEPEPDYKEAHYSDGVGHRNRPVEISYYFNAIGGTIEIDLSWSPHIGHLGLYLYDNNALITKADTFTNRSTSQAITANIDAKTYRIVVKAIERHGNFDLYIQNTN